MTPSKGNNMSTNKVAEGSGQGLTDADYKKRANKQLSKYMDQAMFNRIADKTNKRMKRKMDSFNKSVEDFFGDTGLTPTQFRNLARDLGLDPQGPLEEVAKRIDNSEEIKMARKLLKEYKQSNEVSR